MLDSSSFLSFEFGNVDAVKTSAPFETFDPLVTEFLSDLSLEILSSKKSKEFPDLVSFAFWCRPSNLSFIKSQYSLSEIRIGLGKVLHITPRNVPMNFAFSWALSALAGNCNFVKLPSNEYPQIQFFLDIFSKVSKAPKHSLVGNATLFFRTNHSSEFIRLVSSFCEARIIWGSDKTISEFKLIKAPPRTFDLSFPSRISVSVISGQEFLDSSQLDQEQLVKRFLQDSMTFGQRGCSSPRMVFWVGDLEAYLKAKEKFWGLARTFATKFLQMADAFERLSHLCIASTTIDELSDFSCSIFGPFIVLDKLDGSKINLESILSLGTFLEHRVDNCEEIFTNLNKNLQTITYFGVDTQDLLQAVKNLGFLGVDRIVPFGTAFEMSSIWDGVDTIRSLSRVIDIR